MVVPWVELLFPHLEGLPERLREPTARFLDVGSGVGRLSIEMCRRFPNLRVVGIDPFETALTLARRNVAEAGLGDQIELRPERVQDLTDERCYDLAWVPVLFMAADVAARGLHRVHTALRPGGWAVLGSLAVEGGGDPARGPAAREPSLRQRRTPVTGACRGDADGRGL